MEYPWCNWHKKSDWQQTICYCPIWYWGCCYVTAAKLATLLMVCIGICCGGEKKQLLVDAEALNQIIAEAAGEAAKATLLLINEEGRRQSMSTKHSSVVENTRHRTGSSVMQPVFNWNAKDKYTQAKNFMKLEVTNKFVTKHCEIYDTEKVPVINIWLRMKQLQFIQTSVASEQEACKMVKWLFDTLCEKFKLNMMGQYYYCSSAHW